MRFILIEAKALPMDFYLQRLQDVITSAIAGMKSDDFSRHPEGKWCAAEILEHLYLTYTGTIKGFERCLNAGKPIATAPTFKQRLSTLIVTGLGYMPEGRKSPKAVIPRGVQPEKIAVEIVPQIAVMAALIQRCEERFGANARLVDHPIIGPLTAQQWRKFHWVHGRLHAKQIVRLKTNAPSAPASVGAGRRVP